MMKNNRRGICLLFLFICLLFPSCRCANAAKGQPAESGSPSPNAGIGAASGGSDSAGLPAAPSPGSATDAAPQAGQPSVKAPAPPTFGTEAGPHPGNITVAIAAEAGATLRYSLDGSVPGLKSGRAYTQPIALDSSAVVTAIAIKDQRVSRPAARTYTLKEVCAAPGGSGPGTRDKPAGSIGQAIGIATRLGIGEIKLASGEYRESVETSSAFALSGGWAADFAKRGKAASVIVGVSGGDKSDAPRAAVIGSGSSCSIALSRLELRSEAAPFTAGLFLRDGAQAVLVDCVLSGGSGTSSYAAKLVKKSSLSLTASTLKGGSADTCVGLSLDSSNARLIRCRVDAGTGSVASYGVSCTSSVLLAASSAIYGGEANTSYGIGFYASPGGSVFSSTVHGGKGKSAYGIMCSQSSPAIKSSIIGAAGSAKSFGIYENYGNSSPSALEANALWGSASGLYYDVDTKTAFNAMDDSGNPAREGKVLSTPKGKGNLAWAGSLGPDLATPRDPLLASGGAAPDEAAAIDLQGRKRDAPWSIGAVETD
jgi:hypothetical protein